MKILFIGGTGVISTACAELCAAEGYQLTILNRGITANSRNTNVNYIQCDINDTEKVKNHLAGKYYDAIVNWIVYTPEQIQRDFELFRDKTSQYIFISSASAYNKPAAKLPITEEEPLINPYWRYSQLKIECESKLIELYHLHNFPSAIVRPSHTYDKTKLPIFGGYTLLHRMLTGREVIIHGDGTSLWTLTHNTDFAKGFIGLLGKSESIGEAYHITSDEVLTWNQICGYLAGALGVEPNIIHIPSDYINMFDKEWGDGLLGDKAHCMIFDNSKIKAINPKFKAVVPYREGAKEIVAWYLSNDSLKQVDHQKDMLMDKIIKSFKMGYIK